MIWWVVGTAAASFFAGRASRQPEVNRLKQQVLRLQQQVEELQGIIEQQNKTITQLKFQYKAMSATRIFEKKRVKQRTKGALIFQYSYKEYIELSIVQAKGKGISQEETMFYRIFDSAVRDEEVSTAEKGIVKLYIMEKYAHEVKHGVELDSEDLVGQLRGVDVA